MNLASMTSSEWTRYQQTDSLSCPLLQPQEREKPQMQPHSVSGREQSQVPAAAASSILDVLLTWVFSQAARWVQSTLLVSVIELKLLEAACAKLDPTGLGCHSDPAAFCNSVSNWYKAQASAAANPKPPRLNLAAKDNSQGTRAAVGRSVHPPSLKDAPVLIQSMSSRSKSLKTKMSMPEIKAADQCPCVKRPIIPTRSRQLASDAACQRDEHDKYPLHIPGTFRWHRRGWRRAKGLPGFKNTPPSPDTVFKASMVFALPPFQNLELKVSKASSEYHAMLLEH